MKNKLTKDEAFALLCAVESLMSDRDEAAMKETGLRHLDRESGLDCPPAFANAYFSAVAKLEAITGCDLGSADYWEPAECTESIMARLVNSMLAEKRGGA